MESRPRFLDKQLNKQTKIRFAETMNMNEIPTPETDAVEKAFTADSKQNPQHRLALKSRDLERRLTVAREAMQAALTASFRGQTGRAHSILDEAITQTAPKP